MRALRRNKQDLYYCLYQGKTRLYDSYVNDTGEDYPSYSEATLMRANVSPATGQSNVEIFGALDNYDKVIVTDWVDCPIDEHSVLFVDKVPEYKDDIPVYDYIVRRVAKSLNSVSIAIRKVDVQ